MKKLSFIISGMIYSLLIFSIPILTTISWFLGWDLFVKILLIIVFLGELIMLGIIISWKIEDEE